MAEIPLYPLYGLTYRLYRLSPLHHSDATLLNERPLRTHAKRLKEQLKGDNVRGVEIDLAGAEAAMPNLGPLELCTWDLLGDEDEWIDRHQQILDPDASQLTTLDVENARGIEVTLEYTKANNTGSSHTYNALLLRDPGTTRSPPGFTSLPLLLVKMPAPVREVFLNYLRTNFDAHVAPLKLAPPFLTSTLETYLRHLAAPGSTQTIRDAIKQLQIQLSFPASTTLLRHIDIHIAAADVPGFFKRGKLLPDAKDRPFTAALRSYIQKHLALDISQPKVQVSKITTNVLTIQADRIKIVSPEAPADAELSDESDAPEANASQLAVRDLYAALVKEAAGTGKFLSEGVFEERRSETPMSSTGSARRRGRKRAVSHTAPGNALSKRRG